MPRCSHVKRLPGPETGYLGELTVDRDILVGSGGRAVPWIPLVDAHGIDRAYSWTGIGPPAFAQIKTATELNAEGLYEWEMRADALHRHRRFSLVLVGLPPTPSDRPAYWCLDGATVPRHASTEYDRRKRTEAYVIRASPVRPDQLAKYRCTADQLWRRLLPESPVSSPLPLGFPTLRVDQGGLYELATVTDLLAQNRKDLLVFRPAFDVHGRDLLVQLVGTQYAMYLQVKGTTVVRDHDRLQFLIRPQTFVAADDFCLLFRYWNRGRHEMFPEDWLMSSREVDRRTAHQRKLTSRIIEVHLDRERDLLADCRYPASEIADQLRGALRGLRRAA